MIRVRATERGYYGDVIREAGDEFEFDDKKHVLGSWMEPLEVPKHEAPKTRNIGRGQPERDEGDVL